MRGYIKVILATGVMIAGVCAGWMATCSVVHEQVTVAGDLLQDLKVQDFRECMQRDLPPDAPEGVEAVIHELCEELSGLK